MTILYQDNRIVVCIKPAGVLSTDEPGGLPQLLREQLGDGNPCVRTVHRLDRVVSGLMVLARSRAAASILSRQMREDTFGKEYLAVLQGIPETPTGILTDLLLRSKEEKKTYVVSQPGKGVQEAALDYTVLGQEQGLSLVKITLRTGRTHQIRAQFSSRNLPLVGDRKYGGGENPDGIALFSHRLTFAHPQTGEPMDFSAPPPKTYPWTLFPQLW